MDRLLARLRFRHLQLLVEVARNGSLSGAATVLNLTQPALSKALKEVEDLLGFAVFHRAARGVAATPEGQLMVDGASLMLREINHIRAEARAAGAGGAWSGILRLGTSAFLAVTRVPSIVARVTQSTPAMRVTLRESNVPRLFQELLSGELDALITLYDSEAMRAAGGKAVKFESIADEPYVVIAPSGHHLAKARAVSWKNLALEPWIFTAKPSLARAFVEDSFRLHGIAPPVPVCETAGPVTATQLVAAAVGLSSVPKSSTRAHVHDRHIVILKLRNPQPTATVGLAYRSVASTHLRIRLLRQALGLA